MPVSKNGLKKLRDLLYTVHCIRVIKLVKNLIFFVPTPMGLLILPPKSLYKIKYVISTNNVLYCTEYITKYYLMHTWNYAFTVRNIIQHKICWIQKKNFFIIYPYLGSFTVRHILPELVFFVILQRQQQHFCWFTNNNDFRNILFLPQLQKSHWW